MLDTIKKELDELGKNLQEKGINDNTSWTREIKNTFIELGKKYKLITCVGGKACESDWGEWLYDISWLKTKDIDGYDVIEKMILAVESEWGIKDEEILEDFQKLLVCNAEMKVFIFQDRKDIINLLKKTVEIFKESNGNFLLAMYDNTQIEFKYTLI